MSDLITPQPDPIKNELPASWDLVMEDYQALFTTGPVIAVLVDMRGRDRFGFDKYGVRIQPSNGRDNMVDAYQEVLDGAVYLRAALYELEQAGDEAADDMREMFNRTLVLVHDLRSALWERDGK